VGKRSVFDRNAFLKNVEWIIQKKCGGNRGRFNEQIGQRSADYRWRAEGSIPSLEAVIKICDTFDLRVDWLLSGRGDPQSDDLTKEELRSLVQEYKELADRYRKLWSESKE
jgi:hypothetical protein